jgi:NAD+ kinase
VSTVALVVNESRPRAVELAQEAAAWLTERDVRVVLSKSDAQAAGLDAHGVEPGQLEDGLDLVVALGGDGTTLRAVHLAAPSRTPVLGVNLGRLAYLTTLEPHELCDALARFEAGDYGVEERTMLCASVGGSATSSHLALNEAVLEHSGAGHTVHLSVTIAGQFFTSYVADALIVATPTGSTAYSFSAGGPIVSPRHEGLVVTPVSPHTPFSRSLLLHPSEPVCVEVLDHRGAILSVDGQDLGRLEKGDTLTAEVAPVHARFVTVADRDFFGVLKVKFGLADR